MRTAKRQPARALTLVAALLLMVLSLGAGGAAFADPGNGKGDGQSQGNGKQDPPAAEEPAPATDAGSDASSADAGKSDNGKSDAKKSDNAKSDAKKADPGTTGKAKGNGKAGSHATDGTAGTSGDVGSPQPPSNADQNSGGANGKCPGGPYCSTRDGSASGNGNGNGKAVGKPCAGCVGKADNKNPKGQHPNGSDHNAGYECDRNHGIGRTNPAHTGCVSTPPPPCVDQPGKPCTPPPPCVDQPGKPCTPPPPCVDEPGKPCTPAPPPSCETDASLCEPACVEGVDEACTPTTPNRPPAVLGVEQFAHKPGAKVLGTSAVAPAVLPSTGAGDGLGLLALAGLGLVTTGATTLVLRRRPRRT